MYISNPAQSFTRPNNTTAYATGQLVANSTTAGSVVPLGFDLGNKFPIAQFRLTRVRLVKSGVGVSNATFRLHFYQGPTAPVAANGDGAAWSTSGAAQWLGNVDISSMLAFTDGAAGTGSAPAGSEMYVRANQAGQIYALVAALGAYTPAANEVFTVVPEFLEVY